MAREVTQKKNRPIRILLAKPGLDGHDRGAKVVARALRDAGFEVIYTGRHQTPAMIVRAAIQEDADAIGISILSGAHNRVFSELLSLLKKQGMHKILLFGGGIIPPEDVRGLKKLGVREIFLPGTSTDQIVKFVEDQLKK